MTFRSMITPDSRLKSLIYCYICLLLLAISAPLSGYSQTKDMYWNQTLGAGKKVLYDVDNWCSNLIGKNSLFDLCHPGGRDSNFDSKYDTNSHRYDTVSFLMSEVSSAHGGPFSWIAGTREPSWSTYIRFAREIDSAKCFVLAIRYSLRGVQRISSQSSVTAVKIEGFKRSIIFSLSPSTLLQSISPKDSLISFGSIVYMKAPNLESTPVSLLVPGSTLTMTPENLLTDSARVRIYYGQDGFTDDSLSGKRLANINSLLANCS